MQYLIIKIIKYNKAIDLTAIKRLHALWFYYTLYCQQLSLSRDKNGVSKFL